MLGILARRLGALGGACLIALVCAACRQPEVEPRQRDVRAFVLDSAEMEEKRSYDSAVAALADSSPAELDSLRRLLAFSTHMQLARLGYIGGPFDVELTNELRKAVRRYAADRGIATTTDLLSFDLMTALRRDDTELQERPRLPTRFVSAVDGYAHAAGAWVFEGQGNQEIAVEMRCYRGTNECIESQAIMSRLLGGLSLTTDLQRWTIHTWDDAEIVTLPENFTCTRYVLRINLVQQTATKIRSTISSARTCANVERRDLVIELRDGPQLAGERASNGAPMSKLVKLTPRAVEMFDAKGK